MLPRVLENIEAELAKERLNLAKEVPLRRRAELIRSLLAPERITKPVAIEIAGAGSGPARASAVSPEARNARTCERGRFLLTSLDRLLFPSLPRAVPGETERP